MSFKNTVLPVFTIIIFAIIFGILLIFLNQQQSQIKVLNEQVGQIKNEDKVQEKEQKNVPKEEEKESPYKTHDFVNWSFQYPSDWEIKRGSGIHFYSKDGINLHVSTIETTGFPLYEAYKEDYVRNDKGSAFTLSFLKPVSRDILEENDFGTVNPNERIVLINSSLQSGLILYTYNAEKNKNAEIILQDILNSVQLSGDFGNSGFQGWQQYRNETKDNQSIFSFYAPSIWETELDSTQINEEDFFGIRYPFDDKYASIRFFAEGFDYINYEKVDEYKMESLGVTIRTLQVEEWEDKQTNRKMLLVKDLNNLFNEELASDVIVAFYSPELEDVIFEIIASMDIDNI